jgi:hypothetical protein
VCVFAVAVQAQAAGHRRALLVGINDYTASRLGAASHPPAPGRDWPNLSGAVNDVAAVQQMLMLLYGFDAHDIVTLADQAATRDAILAAIDHTLVQPAEKGDVVFFYFAGHGSQVRNTKSDEADRLDESIVPADSRGGARDIRDKELRPLFNRILDRGARLTVMLDNCHSGSGARGLPTGARVRGVRADPRDIADGTGFGERPEARGALVLSAAQDFDDAYETKGDDGLKHGAFSWAWLRAVRVAGAGEPAQETFLRAQARLRAETPYQEPVLAGTTEARLNPFLGIRPDRRAERAVVAIERVRADGTVVVSGGWVNGLDAGSELRLSGEPHKTTVHLRVTTLRGLGECEARLPAGHPLPQSVKPGALLEVCGWAAPAPRPLRVWMPRAGMSGAAITAVARRLNTAAITRRVRWLRDPSDVPPTHFLRWTAGGWQLLHGSASESAFEKIGGDDAAVAAIASMTPGSTLFVQLPAPAAVVDNISVGPGTDREGIAPVEDADEADYILIGRFTGRILEYAWMRPAIRKMDRRKCGLPVHSHWNTLSSAVSQAETSQRDLILSLRDDVLRLRKIRAWHLLESPPESRSPYHLAIRREKDGEIVHDAVMGGEQYSLLLRAQTPMPARVAPRFVYVFCIDSFGKSVLLFPSGAMGSVENHLPLAPQPGDMTAYPPAEIALAGSSMRVQAPYGVDTYLLLTTDEPLPNPEILQWDGVRGALGEQHTALEELIVLTGDESRSVLSVTPASWSLERLVCESVPQRTSKRKKAAAQLGARRSRLLRRQRLGADRGVAPAPLGGVKRAVGEVDRPLPRCARKGGVADGAGALQERAVRQKEGMRGHGAA